MEPLITTDELAHRLGEPALRIFDCTTFLHPEPGGRMRVETGRAAYGEKGHIPGAALIELQQDLSDAQSALRFTMPAPEALARMAGAKGIGEDSEVVLYCNGTQWWATRVWWQLRAIGFDRARILDGGFRKWIVEGRPVEHTANAYSPAALSARPRAGLMIGKDAVLGALDHGGAVVVNCLTEEQHRGTGGAHYGRPGHITGSVSLPAASLFEADGTFKDTGTLRAMFADRGIEEGGRRVIAYCGGGIAATGDAFALVALLGHGDVAVYDASLQEWASDPRLPMSVA
ncbi:MAG: sulfurtransferase [Alphaproteobacteria bacterium]|nr:sulfurtransferase [Alphaproteobacteria bacterium]MCW5742000.1 sulfurtransferase [Alphaproteobacteria bacterium]